MGKGNKNPRWRFNQNGDCPVYFENDSYVLRIEAYAGQLSRVELLKKKVTRTLILEINGGGPELSVKAMPDLPTELDVHIQKTYHTQPPKIYGMGEKERLEFLKLMALIHLLRRKKLPQWAETLWQEVVESIKSAPLTNPGEFIAYDGNPWTARLSN